ncbi:hypothetical protein AB1286_01095 [Trinickia sp. NRRL B-1857]|uniref:hypothetical protein n=1 Tax=Trinickia sp. NRRL B-1857 TaxID=3162879 RepID=UPI003D293252
MSVEVSIQHVSSGLYLWEMNDTIVLFDNPYPWSLNATAQDVIDYAFQSPILGQYGWIGSATGTLDIQSQDDLALVSTDDFLFSHFLGADWGGAATGYPIQVYQGELEMLLNVTRDKPIKPVFGESPFDPYNGWVFTYLVGS